MIDTLHPMYLNSPAPSGRAIMKGLGCGPCPPAGDPRAREEWMKARHPKRNSAPVHHARGTWQSVICQCSKRKPKASLYCGACTRAIANDPEAFAGKRGPDSKPRARRGASLRHEGLEEERHA